MKILSRDFETEKLFIFKVESQGEKKTKANISLDSAWRETHSTASLLTAIGHNSGMKLLDYADINIFPPKKPT